MVHPDNGILFGRKNEWSTGSCMDMPGKYYGKLKKTQTQRNTYDSIYE